MAMCLELSPRKRSIKKGTCGMKMCFVTLRNNQKANLAEVKQLRETVGADTHEGVQD